VAALGPNKFVLAWTQSGGGNELKYQLFNVDPTTHALSSGSSMSVLADAVRGPDIAVLPNGEFVVAWLRADSVGSTIHAQLFGADGTPDSPDTTLSDLAGDGVPSVVALQSGEAVVTWSHFVAPSLQTVTSEFFHFIGVNLANTVPSLTENASTLTRIKVADLGITDSATGTIALGLTGTDAAFFDIIGTSLYLKAGTALDFETKPSYAVAVTVDDSSIGTAPDSISATYTLGISNVNEAPAILSKVRRQRRDRRADVHCRA
jgi:hypothetical protein